MYWTLIGEIGLVLIGVLGAVILVILKDRKKLKEYSDYLKGVIKKLKKKLQQIENEQDQERVLDLLNALVEHVRGQYQSQFGNNIASAEEDKGDKISSVDKFVLIAGFQTMIAELSALENSNDPETTWIKIKNELTPLFQNYLAPVLSEQSDSNNTEDENLKAQLENSNKRIENLEKFKQLFFDLQSKLSLSVTDIETLNQQILTLLDGSDHSEEIKQIIEKNKSHYLEMGQMIGMDKEQHHDSVANKMDYSNALINERKDEIKRLKGQISQQFEDIWQLQGRLSDTDAKPPEAQELSAGIEMISRNLKDAEMCIETMDMEIQTLTSEITTLRKQRKELDGGGEAVSAEQTKQLEEKEIMITRFSQESKELMNCITGLEDDNQAQYSQIKKLEEKNTQLQAEYSSMEAKYLEAMNK